MLLTLQREYSNGFELVLYPRHEISICCWPCCAPSPLTERLLLSEDALSDADTDIANSGFERKFHNKAGLEIRSKSINFVLHLGFNAPWKKYPSERHCCMQESPVPLALSSWRDENPWKNMLAEPPKPPIFSSLLPLTFEQEFVKILVDPCGHFALGAVQTHPVPCGVCDPCSSLRSVNIPSQSTCHYTILILSCHFSYFIYLSGEDSRSAGSVNLLGLVIWPLQCHPSPLEASQSRQWLFQKNRAIKGSEKYIFSHHYRLYKIQGRISTQRRPGEGNNFTERSDTPVCVWEVMVKNPQPEILVFIFLFKSLWRCELLRQRWAACLPTPRVPCVDLLHLLFLMNEERGNLMFSLISLSI